MIHNPEHPSEDQITRYAITQREVKVGRGRLAKDQRYQELKAQLNSPDTPDVQRDVIASEMQSIHDAAMIVPTRRRTTSRPTQTIGR